jgi:hypothetical protein
MVLRAKPDMVFRDFLPLFMQSDLFMGLESAIEHYDGVLSDGAETLARRRWPARNLSLSRL